MAVRSIDEVHVHPSIEHTGELLFPDGMIGCAHWRRFTIQPHPEVDDILVMHLSADEDATFVLAPVAMIVLAYRETLHPDDAATLASLGVGEREEVSLYCTLNVQSTGGVTANLLGPLVIDWQTRVGRQVVLSLSPWTTRHVVSSLPEQEQG